MQLFISDYIHINQNIRLNDTEILNQLKTVLRYRVGDVFYIQKPVNIGDLDDRDVEVIRYQIKITYFDKVSLDGVIIGQENLTTAVDNKTVIVGMPNKWEKLELICQKLTEIGIQNIIVYFSKRSIIKQSNKNKITRINKIIRESVEQSFGIIIPTLSWEDNLTFDTDDLIFYEGGEKLDLAEIGNFRNTGSIVIGPEGGWDEVELDMFRASGCKFISIGPTVLRTETAAILGGWIIKNL